MNTGQLLGISFLLTSSKFPRLTEGDFLVVRFLKEDRENEATPHFIRDGQKFASRAAARKEFKGRGKGSVFLRYEGRNEVNGVRRYSATVLAIK